ncbi:DUF1707 domain-containing protein [Streptomyces sp. NPDC047971]|uniref:DUF1707 SHOCT-like domain-containing protein n=1 Tax=Streptomyces sp. NPDC047971 TaxID=3154499 RepID=UPI0033E5C946
MDDRSRPAASGIRISDQDRDRTLAVLATALVEGRLDPPEHTARAGAAVEARTAAQLAELTADLPATRPTRAERERGELAEWLAEWRYWLGGLVIMSGIWGVRCLQKGELTFYWPVTPLGIWAAVLIAIAIWPGDSGRDGES